MLSQNMLKDNRVKADRKKKGFFKFFRESFIMPKDIKAGIISKNLHRLAQLEQILFSFGIIMIIVSFVRFGSDWKAHYDDFIYYAAYILNSLIVLLAAIQTTHHPEWPVWRRNQPTYLAIFFLLLLSVYLLFTSSTPLSFYTVYVNVCIIAIVMLAVEPAFFIFLLGCFTVAICIRLHSVGSVTMILNMILTSIIMSILSLYKWNALINEFTLEKVQKTHIQSMEKEIELAAFVQESFTKRKMPKLVNYEVSFYSKAMAGVSGDMYDFYTQGTVLNGAGIFDVSGHGIASGLVTMLVRNIFQQEFHQNLDKPLYEVVEIIDKRIKKEKRNIENYLTGILLRMNDDKVEIVNAGHPSAVLYRKASHECFYFDEKRHYSSSVIGLNSVEPFFQQTEFKMEKGDEIFLYTDGVKEALNAEHTEYGSNRIINSIKSAVSEDFDNQIHKLLADMGMFTGNESQSDDITIVIIKKL